MLIHNDNHVFRLATYRTCGNRTSDKPCRPGELSKRWYLSLESSRRHRRPRIRLVDESLKFHVRPAMVFLPHRKTDTFITENTGMPSFPLPSGPSGGLLVDRPQKERGRKRKERKPRPTAGCNTGNLLSNCGKASDSNAGAGAGHRRRHRKKTRGRGRDEPFQIRGHRSREGKTDRGTSSRLLNSHG